MAKAGEIRYEVHYLPVFPVTASAIFAVQCAGEQGYWWAMHSRILEDQTRGIRAVQTLDDLDALLARYAEELGLDMAAYRQCLASEEKVQGYIDWVNEQIATAQDLGIRGTPTFVINGEPVEMDSFDDILKAVREELSRE
jgi:protein-disulfide isomerase